jgi:hypothetical protein
MPLALPRDAPAWAALGLALVAIVIASRPRLVEGWVRHPRRLSFVLAGIACLLSVGYIAHYLRGGPRIIDATSYWLEARALAKGWLAFPVPEPTAAFRGRFLVPSPDGEAFSVIFPPGYPAFLALGFLVGAPLAMGPLLAILLTLATYALAFRLFRDERLALFAALLSVLCAALRYHTADTMSHGWAALLFVVALFCLVGEGPRRTWLVLASGVALGWLIATRPVTGVVGVVCSVLVLFRAEPRKLGWLVLGLVPGSALLLLHQHAATGSFLGSTQLRYYALADGPPGCFRYGFGPGIGCLHEHGDFVRQNLPNGLDARAALGVLGRRLWLHLSDVQNAWPLGLLVPLALWVGRRDAGVRLLGIAILFLIVAYTPFYFDGNYPGGGARMFAEALPLEHVLLAWLAMRITLLRFVPAIALGGFALHTGGYHRALTEREGGHPMFEPHVLANANVRSGLVFVESDHGFALGHVPGARDANTELIVARRHEDARDHALFVALGRPPTFRYTRAMDSSPARIEPFVVPESDDLEAEADWPPLAVRGGWVDATYPSASCLAGSGALALHPSGTGPVEVDLELVPGDSVMVLARFVALAPGPVRVRLEVGGVGWEGAGRLGTTECWEVEGPIVALGAKPGRLRVSVEEGTVALDRLRLRRSGK